MKASNKIKVAILGYGVVGKKRHDSMLHAMSYDIVAISDKGFKTHKKPPGKHIQYFDDFNELLDSVPNLDAVFISLPNKFAAKATIKAIKKKLHVFCEKPPARNVRELLQVRSALYKSAKRLKLMYGFNHRYHHSVTSAKALIDSKKFGKIINMRGVYGKSQLITFNQTDWRTKREESGGGVLLDQGIHMLDLMVFFSGEFNQVHSFVSNSFWNHDVEDNAFILMKSKSGIVSQLHSSATEWRHKFNLEINLEKGSIILSGILSGSKSYGDEKLIIITAKPNEDNGQPLEQVNKFNKDPSWDTEVKTFSESILKNKIIKSGTIDQALYIMRLIEKIYNSDPAWKKNLSK
jgi:predicted dehydrogenase